MQKKILQKMLSAGFLVLVSWILSEVHAIARLVTKPGVNHIIVYGAKSIGETEVGPVFISCFHLLPLQKDLICRDVALDQSQLIVKKRDTAA